ncbi:unnamed protein product, partial [Ilex paraguariensis]
FNGEHTFNGPVGQVYVLVFVGNDLLFADDIILAWKSSFVISCPEPAASLKGYTCAVLSLVVGANRL